MFKLYKRRKLWPRNQWGGIEWDAFKAGHRQNSDYNRFINISNSVSKSFLMMLIGEYFYTVLSEEIDLIKKVKKLIVSNRVYITFLSLFYSSDASFSLLE